MNLVKSIEGSEDYSSTRNELGPSRQTYKEAVSIEVDTLRFGVGAHSHIKESSAAAFAR